MARRFVEDLSPDEAQLLHVAAVVGVASPTMERERQGFADAAQGLGEARALFPLILDTAQTPPTKTEAARAELRRRHRKQGSSGIT
jgi:hypothetical protein